MPHEQEQDKKLNALDICMAEIKKDITFIKEGICDIKKEITGIKQNYVTKEQFKPVQKIAYGLVGTVLTAIVLAIVYSIIK